MNQRIYIDYIALRKELSFETVLNAYNIEFPLGKTQFKTHCPFHDDSDPSFSANLDKKCFQCFGCGKKGNTLEFVAYSEGLDPEDKNDLHQSAVKAIEIIGKTPGDFKKTRNNSSKSTKKETAKAVDQSKSTSTGGETKDTPFGASDGSKELKPNSPLSFQLKDLDYGHSYLRGRGISPEEAEAFGVGFCKRGTMKGRIVFPIHNLKGEIVAYTGRWADDDLPEDKDRYKIPSSFRKSLELYNLYQAKKLAEDAGLHYLVLVEGTWSARKLHSERQPVASLLGWSISEAQCQLIADAGFKRIIVMLDGDDAGRRAIPDVVTALARLRYVHVIELPEGMKPDKLSGEYFSQLR